MAEAKAAAVKAEAEAVPTSSEDEEDEDEEEEQQQQQQQQLFTIADLDKFSLQEIDYLLCLNHLSMVSKSNKTKAQKMKLLCAAQKKHHVQLPAEHSVSDFLFVSPKQHFDLVKNYQDLTAEDIHLSLISLGAQGYLNETKQFTVEDFIRLITLSTSFQSNRQVCVNLFNI